MLQLEHGFQVTKVQYNRVDYQRHLIRVISTHHSNPTPKNAIPQVHSQCFIWVGYTNVDSFAYHLEIMYNHLKITCVDTYNICTSFGLWVNYFSVLMQITNCLSYTYKYQLLVFRFRTKKSLHIIRGVAGNHKLKAEPC